MELSRTASRPRLLFAGILFLLATPISAQCKGLLALANCAESKVSEAEAALHSATQTISSPGGSATIEGITYSLLACVRDSEHAVTCVLTVTNRGPQRALQLKSVKASQLGTVLTGVAAFAGGTNAAPLPPGMPMGLSLTFTGVPASTAVLPLVSVMPSSGGQLLLRGIPITDPGGGAIAALTSKASAATRFTQATSAAAGGLAISSISPIRPGWGKQTIIIRGSGFGTHAPYNGCTKYLSVEDVAGRWTAGLRSRRFDVCPGMYALYVKSWTNSRIVIGGFPRSFELLRPGDEVLIKVANAQTSSGLLPPARPGSAPAPSAWQSATVGTIEVTSPEPLPDNWDPTSASSPGGPSISSITPIGPGWGKQTIVIRGSGFGTHAPYNGCTRYLSFEDVAGDWVAGLRSRRFDVCPGMYALYVKSWTDSQIVIGGFPRSFELLSSGDEVLVRIANARARYGLLSPGPYVLPDPSAWYALSVSKPGQAAQVSLAVTPAIVAPGARFSISGRVADALGNQAADTTVDVTESEGGPPGAATPVTTSADGSFAVAAIAPTTPGLVTVNASLAGSAGRAEATASVTVQAGGATQTPSPVSTGAGPPGAGTGGGSASGGAPGGNVTFAYSSTTGGGTYYLVLPCVAPPGASLPSPFTSSTIVTTNTPTTKCTSEYIMDTIPAGSASYLVEGQPLTVSVTINNRSSAAIKVPAALKANTTATDAAGNAPLLSLALSATSVTSVPSGQDVTVDYAGTPTWLEYHFVNAPVVVETINEATLANNVEQDAQTVVSFADKTAGGVASTIGAAGASSAVSVALGFASLEMLKPTLAVWFTATFPGAQPYSFEVGDEPNKLLAYGEYFMQALAGMTGAPELLASAVQAVTPGSDCQAALARALAPMPQATMSSWFAAEFAADGSDAQPAGGSYKQLSCTM